eukprot:TRINITY_DN8917_c0_g1_i2.p2 TRINITY_DN8917_c0_g1~~TRINITY_DN8917_c0_g1_i2.p2  ORF type:complete len:147 (-),score=30.28 TRINITY_DN8917_c0_g1_i2:251-691(-)
MKMYKYSLIQSNSWTIRLCCITFSDTLIPVGNTSMNAGTKVVQFMNMLSLEELRDTAEYNDIVIDIREECAKYGKVLSIEIPRPTPEHGLGGIYGKAFVEFDSVEAAKLAANNIAGRLFNNRPVTVAFVNEDEYHEYRLSVNASSE